MKVEFLERLEDVELLRDRWHGLEAALPKRSLACSYDYLISWYRTYGVAQGRPLVGLIHKESELLGIAPWAYWRGTLGGVPVRRVDLAGHNCGVGEMLLPELETATLAAILEALLRHASLDLVSMLGLDPRRGEVEIARAAADRLRLGFETIPYYYAVVDLSRGYEGYCHAMSANFRRNLKRKARSLGEAGGSHVDVLDTTVDEGSLDRALERMFAIADASWKAGRGNPMAAVHRNWYLEVARRMNQKGMLDLSILTIGGRDAAYILGFVDRGIYYDGTISYVDEFAALSPGMVLLQEVLERLPGRGVHTVVSHGDHEYKRRWASSFVPHECAFFFPRSPRALLGRVARFRLAGLWSRFRPRDVREQGPIRHPEAT